MPHSRAPSDTTSFCAKAGRHNRTTRFSLCKERGRERERKKTTDTDEETGSEGTSSEASFSEDGRTSRSCPPLGGKGNHRNPWKKAPAARTREALPSNSVSTVDKFVHMEYRKALPLSGGLTRNSSSGGGVSSASSSPPKDAVGSEDADVEIKTYLSRCRHNRKGDVEALLLRGVVTPHSTDGKGLTGLMVAVQNNSREVVDVLVAHGADVNAQCTAGKTALDFAICLKYLDLAEHLKMCGAMTASQCDSARSLSVSSSASTLPRRHRPPTLSLEHSEDSSPFPSSSSAVPTLQIRVEEPKTPRHGKKTNARSIYSVPEDIIQSPDHISNRSPRFDAATEDVELQRFNVVPSPKASSKPPVL